MASSTKSGILYLSIASLFSLFFCQTLLAMPSVKDLDMLWENRSPEQGQKDIIVFLEKAEQLPQDFEINWRIARLVSFSGNYGIGLNTFNKKKKRTLFKYGCDAANIARTIKPSRVEGHYWYATNLGSFAVTNNMFKALKYANEARDALLDAVELDPTYHWGGPYRMLGRFYQEAPPIISFGSKKKAEECFNNALKIAPKFRLNIINLGILKKDIGDTTLALQILQKAQKVSILDGKLEEEQYLVDLEASIKTFKEKED